MPGFVVVPTGIAQQQALSAWVRQPRADLFPALASMAGVFALAFGAVLYGIRGVRGSDAAGRADLNKR